LVNIFCIITNPCEKVLFDIG